VNKDWLDIDVLEDYLDGKLDAKTMNRVEREALEDPFVADALAGLSASPKRALESISLLQRQLAERIDQQKSIKKQSVITWQRLSIGSAAAVLFITVGIVYWMKQVNFDKALNSSKKVDVVIAPKLEKDTILSKETIPALSSSENEVIAKNKQPNNAVAPINGVISHDKVAVSTSEPNFNSARSRVSMMSAPVRSLNTANSLGIVSGRVVDENTGDPIVGAYVYAKDSAGVLKVVATANSNGDFTFKKDNRIVDSTITTSSISYETKVLPVKANQLIVALKPSSESLSEVTVFDGRTKSSKEQTTAILVQSHPIEGWDHYFMYLTNNTKFRGQPRVGKSVELTFNIDSKGSAQNIKIVKGIADKYNTEAVRLVKEGPKWLVPNPPTNIVTIKIDF
jgi:hypothetical protein